MSRTQGSFLADTPHTTGVLFIPSWDLANFSGNLVLTRNALGDYSLNRTAIGAETYRVAANTQAIYRLVSAAGAV